MITKGSITILSVTNQNSLEALHRILRCCLGLNTHYAGHRTQDRSQCKPFVKIVIWRCGFSIIMDSAHWMVLVTHLLVCTFAPCSINSKVRFSLCIGLCLKNSNVHTTILSLIRGLLALHYGEWLSALFFNCDDAVMTHCQLCFR